MLQLKLFEEEETHTVPAPAVLGVPLSRIAWDQKLQPKYVEALGSPEVASQVAASKLAA